MPRWTKNSWQHNLNQTASDNPGAVQFLTDGRVEIDDNTVESTIRPIALNRKNTLFAGHEAGAENWAAIASLVETCKLNTVDPQASMAATLTAIVNGHKQSRIDELSRLWQILFIVFDDWLFAVRASCCVRAHEEIEDGQPDGRQTWLWRRPPGSFFSAPLP